MDKKIVIIGAGSAGIAAATKLLEHGFDHLVVLEAEPRIGGRVKSIPFGDGFIDMGAQWCHGETGNVVFDLAMPLGYIARPDVSLFNDDFNFSLSDGTQLSDDLNEQLFTFLDVFEVQEGDACVGSVGDLVTTKFNNMLQQDKHKNIVGTEMESQILHMLNRYDSILNATDSLADASCRGYAEMHDCAGEKLLDWKNQGYKTVFDLLMKKIPDPSKALPLESKLHFNKSVRSIRWTTDSDRRTVVECNDDSEYEADYVICTVSVGVLNARQSTLFTPELPLVNRNAIDGHKLGTVNKIYVDFDAPFWPENWSGFTILWRDTELAELRANPLEKWFECVTSFATVRYHPNLLCGWLAGPLAREMEALPEGVVQQVVTKWLRRLLKDKVIPEPTTVKRTCWNSEPNFLGSYSYATVRSDELNATRADLSAPVLNGANVPVIQFAGEATSLHHWGTVNGAIETGWREASRIIDLNK